MARPNAQREHAGTGGATLELELPRNTHAPSVARAAVVGQCSDFELDPWLRHTLTLLVSEVVSNAVMHSPAPMDRPIMFATTVGADSIQVSVTDAGEGFTRMPRGPHGRDGGYGLSLVEKSASQWGIDRVGGTRVWFELPRTG